MSSPLAPSRSYRTSLASRQCTICNSWYGNSTMETHTPDKVETGTCAILPPHLPHSASATGVCCTSRDERTKTQHLAKRVTLERRAYRPFQRLARRHNQTHGGILRRFTPLPSSLPPPASYPPPSLHAPAACLPPRPFLLPPSFLPFRSDRVKERI